MPFCVKMGIEGTTGYLGNQSSSKRSIQRFKARRRVLPGFPILTPFKDLKAVRDYLSGDRVVCLLCGKSYKDVGKHIRKIHGMTPDQYRSHYKIPWTYALCCSETSEAYSARIAERMKDGWVPPAQLGEDHKRMVNSTRRDRQQNTARYLVEHCSSIKSAPTERGMVYLEAIKELTRELGTAPYLAEIARKLGLKHHTSSSIIKDLERFGFIRLEVRSRCHNGPCNVVYVHVVS